MEIKGSGGIFFVAHMLSYDNLPVFLPPRRLFEVPSLKQNVLKRNKDLPKLVCPFRLLKKYLGRGNASIFLNWVETTN